MNEFLLLALGLVGCWAVGALNKNVRLGLYLLAAMLTGFVGGAIYSELSLEKDNDSVTVIAPKVVNGSYGSTVLFLESKQDSGMPSSGVLSQNREIGDAQQEASDQQLCVTWGHGLSPPMIENSS